MKYWSRSAKGFYDEDVNFLLKEITNEKGEKERVKILLIPDDAKLISNEDFNILMQGQSEGFTIDFNFEDKPKLITLKPDYKIQAQYLQEKLRKKLSKYLQADSILDGNLVPDEIKSTLVKDSLALARWSEEEGWPLIPLPVLSSFGMKVLSNPSWTYDLEVE